MKPIWIALISVAVIAVQGFMLLLTSGTGALLVASLLNAVNG